MKSNIYSKEIVKRKKFVNGSRIIRQTARNILFLLFIFIAYNSKGQDYTVDWSDTSTYNVTCGKVIPSQWSVKDDSCVMKTPYFRVDAAAGSMISFTLRVNQSGSGFPTDKVYIQHATDGGSWITDTLIKGGGNPAVHTFTFSSFFSFGQYVQLRVIMQTNSHTEFWAIMGGGIGIDDGVSGTTFSSWPSQPPSNLPIVLTSFVGMYDNGNNLLKWVTYCETNNDYFTIEKSSDGLNYYELGTERGAGNSNCRTEYVFEDDSPFDLTYYRLKQTDYDGSSTTSNIIKIDAESSETSNVVVTCNAGSLFMYINSEISGELYINIYGLNGQVLYSGTESLEKGNSTQTFMPDLKKNNIYLISTTINNQPQQLTKIFFN